MARVFDRLSGQRLQASISWTVEAPLTLACWFNSVTTTYGQTLMCLGDADAANSFSMTALGFLGGDPIRAITQTPGGSDNAETTSGYSAATWQHACAVFAASDDRRVYLDAGSKGTNSTDLTPATIDTATIGVTYSNGSYTFYWDGSLAEAAAWTAALTDEEVAVLATGASPLLVRPQSLVMYVPLIRDDDEDIVGGVSFAPANNPTVGVHTRVIYPGVFSLGTPAEAEARQPRLVAYYDGPTIF